MNALRSGPARVRDRVVVVRTALVVLAAIYFGTVLASHLVPLDPSTEFPLAYIPGLLLLGAAVLNWGHRPSPTWLRDLVHPWRLAALFAVLVGGALAIALVGNSVCGSGTGSCIKVDAWRVVSGHYYRHHPYDAAGFDDPSQPWVEISAETYIAEVGTRLRWAAAFGVVELCVIWGVATVLAPRIR